MHTYQKLSAAMALAATTGCASFTNYTQPIDLRNQSYSMDVKQRVVISQKKEGVNARTIVCAEPSPDALTVIGVSGGLSLSSAKLDTTGNLGGALAENGSFVGLRTQSIQLLRDAMYRLCEGYAAGAVTELTFQSLQRRYQSTMMGLIAIEQLTGPVVASQALLTSTATAQSGVPLGDAAVTKAQERVDTTSQNLLNAQVKVDEADAEEGKAQDAVRKANDALATESGKQNPDKSVVDQLKSGLKTATDERNAARRKRQAAHRELAAAQKSSATAEDVLRGTQSRVSASAGGSGMLGDVSGAVAASNEALAKGVVEIVREINISYLRDSCINFSADLLREPTLIKDLQDIGTGEKDTKVSPAIMVASLTRACREILLFDARRLASESGADEKTLKAFDKRVEEAAEADLNPGSKSAAPADTPKP